MTTPIALIPAMTSYTTPSGEVSASSEYSPSRYAAWQAFDISGSTSWFAGIAGVGQWLQYRFEKPHRFTSFEIHTTSSNTHADNYIIQASNDGLNWENINNGKQYSIPVTNNDTKVIDTISDEERFSYIRLFQNSCIY